jgi:predicted heme/steroid binding protein
VLVGSVVLGVLIVVGALVLTGDDADEPAADDQPTTEGGVTPGPVSQAELAAADGQDGRPCLVAVDGTVYEISGFTLWQDGEHAPSSGQAYCGADMSEAIRQAPHGDSKLELLDEVGPLVD